MILDLPINAGFVHDQIDSKLLVGAAQSGTVGFFNQNVVNLDGKIDPKAQYSMRHGGIRTYIDSQRIDVLVDWPAMYGHFFSPDTPETGGSFAIVSPRRKADAMSESPRRPKRIERPAEVLARYPDPTLAIKMTLNVTSDLPDRANTRRNRAL